MKLPKADILFVTATTIETEELLKLVHPPVGASSVFRTAQGANTYSFGLFEGYSIAHLETRMGSQGPSGSHLSISDALQHCKPKCVIMVGIAFGIDRKKQSIGDVLVSTQVVPYEIRRVGQNETVFRGDLAPSDPTLLDRFARTSEWEFSVGKSRTARTIAGPVLSGNLLIDHLEHRETLAQEFPTAVGGEMEGVGLYSAAHRARIPWVLVKGICDFADGKKKVRKHARQKLAAASAASLCSAVCRAERALSALRCRKREAISVGSARKSNEGASQTHALRDSVLFEWYRSEYEPYYYRRKLDRLVAESISAGHVWVHGGSGYGKTCAVTRNAGGVSKRSFHIDLGVAAREDSEGVLRAFHGKLGRVLVPADFKQVPKRASIDEIIDAIAVTLRAPDFSAAVLIVDEVPIQSGGAGESILRAVIALCRSLSELPHEVRPRLAFTSIENPLDVTAISASKLEACIRCHRFERWIDPDLTRLASLCDKTLQLRLAPDELSALVQGADGNPRRLKHVLRTYLTTKGYRSTSITAVLGELTLERN